MMLLRTPQRLKKLGINYQAFIVRIVHVCTEKEGAVKPRDAIGGKEKSLHSLWSVEGVPNAPYPCPADSPTP